MSEIATALAELLPDGRVTAGEAMSPEDREDVCRAPLGAPRPLASLGAWGEADLFGVGVPVWLLAVAFHFLLSLPLLAATAEAQRPEGAPPTALPRLCALPILGFTALLAGAILVRCSLPGGP